MLRLVNGLGQKIKSSNQGEFKLQCLKISNKTGENDRIVFRMCSKTILTYRSIFPPI